MTASPETDETTPALSHRSFPKPGKKPGKKSKPGGTPRWGRKHKFNAKPLRLNGRFFHSQAEADYATMLEAQQAAGEIQDLTYQPKVELVPGITFRPDFSLSSSGSVKYVDVKGVETERFQLVKKLWKLFGPATLEVVRRGGIKQPWRVTEVVIPQGYRIVGGGE